MEEKEIKSLGYANSWSETLEIVKNCDHETTERSVGNCLHNVTCEICGYSYNYDSSG